MPKGYQHLTRDQRCQIAALKSSGFLQKDIATAIGVSVSTISREINRNSVPKYGYDYHLADVQSRISRCRASCKPKRMTPEVIKRINLHLLEGWSPEQISGRLRLDKINISHERIYQHIWEDKRKYGTLFMHLRHRGKKYKSRSNNNFCRSKIPERIDIRERPEIVNTKSRIGDWEGDTIIGAKHQGAILSYVERKSKFTLLAKLKRKTAANVVSATQNKFKTILGTVLTITFDNGSEFSSHKEISTATGARCYFATPYHAWERGLNEHTNGLVREYLPKSTNLLLVTDEKIASIENLLNNRPRKVLGYRTPREVFAEHARLELKIALHC